MSSYYHTITYGSLLWFWSFADSRSRDWLTTHRPTDPPTQTKKSGSVGRWMDPRTHRPRINMVGRWIGGSIHRPTGPPTQWWVDGSVGQSIDPLPSYAPLPKATQVGRRGRGAFELHPRRQKTLKSLFVLLKVYKARNQ